MSQMRTEWSSVKFFTSMSKAKRFVLDGNIEGSGGAKLHFKWHPTNPGNGKTISQFRCNTHVDCKFMARCIYVDVQCFECQVPVNVQHSKDDPCFVRQGCTITVQQMDSIYKMVDLGLTPGRIWNQMLEDEEKRCKDKSIRAEKRADGGLVGERSSTKSCMCCTVTWVEYNE